MPETAEKRRKSAERTPGDKTEAKARQLPFPLPVGGVFSMPFRRFSPLFAGFKLTDASLASNVSHRRSSALIGGFRTPGRSRGIATKERDHQGRCEACRAAVHVERRIHFHHV